MNTNPTSTRLTRKEKESLRQLRERLNKQKSSVRAVEEEQISPLLQNKLTDSESK